jgi:photosystem II stability/assembly factor-like uncharacterized protein
MRHPGLSAFSIFVVAIIFGHAATRPAAPANNNPGRSDFREPHFTRHDELYSIHLNQQGKGWSVGKFGTILHTSNSGKNWYAQISGTHKPLTAVSFADELHGFAVGGGGIILTTDDSGHTWQTRDSTTKAHLLEVNAPSAQRVFVAGSFGTLLSTNDAGAHWKRHSLSWNVLVPRLIRDIGQVEPNLNTVFFIDDEEGWLGGEFGLLLHTRDGGQSWSAKRSGADFPQITSIRFPDRLTGWAVGMRGTVLKTNDGGQTWLAIDAGTKKDLYAVWISGTRGVIVGQGIALETQNGGLQWLSRDFSNTATWLSGVAGDAEGAVVVGQAGLIRRIHFASPENSLSKKKTGAP